MDDTCRVTQTIQGKYLMKGTGAVYVVNENRTESFKIKKENDTLPYLVEGENVLLHAPNVEFFKCSDNLKGFQLTKVGS